MARFTDVILKAVQPNGILFVDHIADYSAGHKRDNGSVYSSRNNPIKWPVVGLTPAQSAVWDEESKTIRAATQEELEAQVAAKAVLDAEAEAIANATADALHENESPAGDLASWNKKEKCLLLVCYKLAKQHWPSMTEDIFFKNVRAEWDRVK